MKERISAAEEGYIKVLINKVRRHVLYFVRLAQTLGLLVKTKSEFGPKKQFISPLQDQLIGCLDEL